MRSAAHSSKAETVQMRCPADWQARRGSFNRTVRPIARSERYVFVRDLSGGGRRFFVFGDALVEVIGLRAAGTRAAVRRAALASFTLSADHDEVVDDDLGAVLFLAGLLVVPGIVVDAAFDIDGAALLQVVAHDFGSAPERLDVVPLSTVLPVTVFVFGALGSGEREGGNGHATRGGLHFRILAQVAQQSHFVDASCHKNRSCLEP